MPFDTSLKSAIDSPTKDFKDFLEQYFEDRMYGLRREQDVGILRRLIGKEREVASKMVLANIGSGAEWLIEATSELDIQEAIPLLKQRFEMTDQWGEKLNIAKTLHDWVGFEGYVEVLHGVMDNGGSFYKQDVVYYATALDKKDALALLFKGLTDADDFTRWIAFGALAIYRKMDKPSHEDNKFYTAEEVYNDKPLFNKRIAELREKLEKD